MNDNLRGQVFGSSQVNTMMIFGWFKSGENEYLFSTAQDWIMIWKQRFGSQRSTGFVYMKLGGTYGPHQNKYAWYNKQGPMVLLYKLKLQWYTLQFLKSAYTCLYWLPQEVLGRRGVCKGNISFIFTYTIRHIKASYQVLLSHIMVINGANLVPVRA